MPGGATSTSAGAVSPPPAGPSSQPPLAPPVPRPLRASTAVQPKALQPSVSVPTPGTPAGVIQANIRGGTGVLQARLAQQAAVRQPRAAPVSLASTSLTGSHGSTQPHPSTLQPKTHGHVHAFPVTLQQKGGGMPLPAPVRSQMEAAFGTDFSDVRIHVGQEASSIGAIAYTWGTNIHFAPGYYNPWSVQGQQLLGHELWHVVQQKSGRVRNPYSSGVAVVQDHALEAEADRMGRQAAFVMLRQKASKD